MNRPADASLLLERLSAADAPAALAPLLPCLEAADRRRIEAALSLADQGRSRFWVARRQGRPLGALRIIVQPGRTAISTLPAVLPEEGATLARQLLDRAVADLAAEGVQLVQALGPRDRGPEADLWTAGGFQHVADLLYLVSPQAAFPDAPPAPRLTFTPYSPPRHQRLARLVERTYAGSLDCPALEARRPSTTSWPDIAPWARSIRRTGCW